MAVAAPPVARSAARSGLTQRAAAPKRDAPQNRKTPASPVRPKLRIGSSSDPLEHDADRTADRVMRQPRFPLAGPERKAPDQVQRKSASEGRKAEQDSKGSTARRKDAGSGGKKDKAARRKGASDSRATGSQDAVRRMEAPGKRDQPVQRQSVLRSEAVERPGPESTVRRCGAPGCMGHDDKKTVRRARCPPTERKKSKPVAPPPTEKQDMMSCDTILRRAPADGGSVDSGAPPAGFETAVSRLGQSSGTSLPDSTRSFMESGFGRSFEGVRMHADSAAGRAASSIDARAFTLGNSVYFGAGQYQPQTHDGRRLIAHELAHVVQQTSGLAQPTVRRNTDKTSKPVKVEPAPDAKVTPPADEDSPKEFIGTAGRIVRGDARKGPRGTFYLPSLRLPKIKGGSKGASNHPVEALQGKPADKRNKLVPDQPFELLGKTERGNVTARRTWINAAQGDEKLQEKLRGKIGSTFGAGARAPDVAEGKASKDEGDKAPLKQGNESFYYLRPAPSQKQMFYAVGTAQQLAMHELVVMPTWDKDGNKHFFDVDHMQELQLGGLDGWDNFTLLDQEANQSSGRVINQTITADVKKLVDEADRKKFWTRERGGEIPESASDVLARWTVSFETIKEAKIDGDKNALWTRPQIEAGEHLAGLQAMTDKQIAAAGLRFTGKQPKVIYVFTNPSGGYFKVLKPAGKKWAPAGADVFYRGFDNVKVEIQEFDSVEEGREVGRLKGRAFYKASGSDTVFDAPNIELPLLQSSSLGFGLYTDKSNLNKALNLLYKQASPVQIDDAGISEASEKGAGALFVEGRIIASIPLLHDIQIPFSIYGDVLKVDFPLPLAGRTLGPIEITESTLSIGASSKGLFLLGSLGFDLRGMGRGRLEGGVGAGGGGKKPPKAPAAPEGETRSEKGFTLGGFFEFESDIFDPARIDVFYADHQFLVDGKFGVKKGVIPGLESARMRVFSGPEGVLIEGEGVLGVAPLKGTKLIVKRLPNGDIDIGADNIPLPVENIPKVSGATLNVHALRNAETGEWVLAGGGSATVDLAGVTGKFMVEVFGPFVTIAANPITINRPPLTGSGHFMVSNRPRDESGKPVDGEPTEMTASGGAEASMPLGKYLTLTVGGAILPNGELEFTGAVKLPPTVDLFDRKPFSIPLFHPKDLDIPIIGISVFGQRIGIFATIGGGLDFVGGVGPGQLRDAQLGARFNPDHPEDTAVCGSAKFAVPADIGLQLELHGGVGAGIPVVSASAGLNIGAQLGVVAEASAEVMASWTPQEGLAAHALAKVSANPQFDFCVGAWAKVTVDLLLKSWDVVDESWSLADFSWGSDLAIGARFPVAWSEKSGLDFDVDKVEPIWPQLDFEDIGIAIVKKVVG